MHDEYMVKITAKTSSRDFAWDFNNLRAAEFYRLNPYLVTTAIENRHWKHIFQHIHAKALLRKAAQYYNAVVARESDEDRQSVAYIEWKTNFKRAMDQWTHDHVLAGFE